ncbi:PEP-CTERM sorting domain-containing protein [Viridibacterium curvum]|uniref:PEP-CTERM sorting domain-containing protein n=1 Tax=Viridibacterium curvum TaxID=1101404 RepID=A0ABP9QBD3_9RHOO
MKTAVLGALLCAGLAAGSLQAATLTGVTITGTYNGSASGLLGVDSGFDTIVGSNITHLDSSTVEYLSSDFLFMIDFSESGSITFFGLPDATASSYVFDFSFSGLNGVISSLSSTSLTGISGTPVLNIIGSNSIRVNLSNVSWTNGVDGYTAQLTVSPVPEPTNALMLLAGLGLTAAALRRSKR